uniref:Transmembrane protein 126A n=1 Tax=Arion vulgaris TaxID=1028688 RepID=A0A0B6ZEV4_9EUPU
MTDQSESRFQRIVALKKGEPVPKNAYQLTDKEILEIQHKRIENFQPQSEMRMLNYGNHVLGAAVTVSGLIINSIFRKNFRLGGLKVFGTYLPSSILPVLLSVGVHEFGIKNKILLGREMCSTCVSVKGGLCQAFIGLCYPYIVSILTCLPTAREYFTLPMPSTPKGVGYVRLLRHVSPTSNVILAIGLTNLMIGMAVSKMELQTFVKHLSKPPTSPDPSLLEDMVNE